MALKARFIPKNPGKLENILKAQCEICEEAIEENLLPKHVWNHHRLKSEQYYLEVLRNEKCKCIYCGEPAKFNNLSKGYHSICQNKECELKLRSDSAKSSKQNLKLNKEKYLQFKNRTSKAVAAIWNERARTCDDVEIRQKIFNSRKASISKMTIDERSEKFGWMNSPEVTSETTYRDWETDRKSTRLNSSHEIPSRMPSSA